MGGHRMMLPAITIQAGIAAVRPLLYSLDPCASDKPDWTGSDAEKIAKAAIDAALPGIERQVREQVAREIEAKAPLAYYPHESEYEKYQGMKHAARIARGEAGL